jgi:hypothetical protein
MSKVAIKGASTGTATFTIESPATNTDRTLVLPDNAGTVLTSASDLAAANLTGNVAAARITDALNAGGSAPIYACRAWVNFDGTTTTPTIRASGNVSSVTRNGTGDYTVNFTTAMPDANYSVATVGSQSWNDDNLSAMGIYQQGGDYNYSTTSIRVRNRYFTGVSDVFNANVQVFR